MKINLVAVQAKPELADYAIAARPTEEEIISASVDVAEEHHSAALV